MWLMNTEIRQNIFDNMTHQKQNKTKQTNKKKFSGGQKTLLKTLVKFTVEESGNARFESKLAYLNFIDMIHK